VNSSDKLLRGRFVVHPNRGVARIIGEEVQRQGFCDLSHVEIARRLGITQRAVKRMLRGLSGRGMISVTERTDEDGKSIPNIVRIASPTWRAVLGLN
jgi:transcription initiation factor IIE alpha subunit